MYDRAEAARRRIVAATSEGGHLAVAYRDVMSQILRLSPDFRQGLALKQLADSCENAMRLVEKTRKPHDNQHGTPEQDG